MAAAFCTNTLGNLAALAIKFKCNDIRYNYKWKIHLSTKLYAAKEFSSYVGATPVCKQDPGSTGVAQVILHARAEANLFMRSVVICRMTHVMLAFNHPDSQSEVYHYLIKAGRKFR